MRPFLKDPELQKQFDQDGYVTVPFLNAAEVEVLKQMYFDNLNQRGGSMLAKEADFDVSAEITYDFTFIDKNSDYKRLVFDQITEVFKPYVDKYLDNYEPIIANFIRKEKDGGEVPLHQNWAFVDESKHTSVSIWVPLVDSNRKNGTLEVIPGSHKRIAPVRGPMIPWTCDKIGRTLIEDYMVPMEVTAGTGVILDDSIIHYSNINKTDGLRLTIQLILIPGEVNSIHYHLDVQNDPETVKVYEVDQNFYMEFHPWIKPQGMKQVDTLKFEQKYLTEEEFVQKLKGPRVDKVPVQTHS